MLAVVATNAVPSIVALRQLTVEFAQLPLPEPDPFDPPLSSALVGDEHPAAANSTATTGTISEKARMVRSMEVIGFWTLTREVARTIDDTDEATSWSPCPLPGINMSD